MKNEMLGSQALLNDAVLTGCWRRASTGVPVASLHDGDLLSLLSYPKLR